MGRSRSIAATRRTAVALLFAVVFCAPALGQTRGCAVRAVEGAPARLLAAGVWSDLAPGPLPAGADRVATGPGARAEIACEGELVLTLGAGADVALAGLLGSGDSVVLRLLRGIVGVDAPVPAWDRFEVQTPLAIASARSTAWLVEYAEPTGAGVFVRSGAVEVAAVRGGATTLLEAGDGVTILPGAATARVVRWGAGRITAAGASLGFGWR